MAETMTALLDPPALSHNLLGQRLGRKGRVTRQRILAAAERLLAQPEAGISLSAVAREASLSMTAIYLYFADLTELLLALLDPVVASAEESHLADTHGYWADAELPQRCLGFVLAHYDYWTRHTRLLHLRNRLADAGDERMRVHRIDAARPMKELFLRQMEPTAEPLPTSSPQRRGMASVLVTSVERVMTVNTVEDERLAGIMGGHLQSIFRAQARLLELGIRECRRADLVNSAQCADQH